MNPDDLVVRMSYVRDEVHTALDAIEAKGYASAVDILEPLVEQGNPKASLNMALLYSEGCGVELDACKAVEMYDAVGRRELRDQLISALAYHNLAVLYVTGRPTFPRDEGKAAGYWELAEDFGASDGPLQSQRGDG